MTEEDAIAWAAQRVDHATMARLHRLAALVIEENGQQNLISPATIPVIWSRHIVDSLQLQVLGNVRGPWLDIGTGGGFPGLVLAAAGVSPIIFAEPRRRRAEFLTSAAEDLACADVTVFTGKVEQLRVDAATISARAVSSVGNLLRAASHCATPRTRWLLPRGSIDRDEIASVAGVHGLMFHVEQSVTDAGSSIVIMEAR